MNNRGGTGNWNRAGRRSGGQRTERIVVGTSESAPTDQTVLGPMCVLGRHDGCAGNCCCKCHGAIREALSAAGVGT